MAEKVYRTVNVRFDVHVALHGLTSRAARFTSSTGQKFWKGSDHPKDAPAVSVDWLLRQLLKDVRSTRFGKALAKAEGALHKEHLRLAKKFHVVKEPKRAPAITKEKKKKDPHEVRAATSPYVKESKKVLAQIDKALKKGRKKGGK